MHTILLIENDPVDLVAQSLLLHCFSYTVLEASNEGEAWFASQQHEGPIHLVMMKAVLENHSTTEFVARLKLVYPQIRALLVCDVSTVELADIPCEYTFVQRPFHVETLAYAITGLLQNPRNRAASFLS
jgi:response regulator RpfG family c-di-GMP phosphodiesterase